MNFFDAYPKISYKFGNLKSDYEFTNLSVYADLIDSIKDDSTVYSFVTIQDGERPDLLSYRLYGNSSLHWTFLFLNDQSRCGSWSLSYSDLNDYLEELLPGQCLVCRDTEVDDDDRTILEMITRFPVGAAVYGSVSGAIGEVYSRNPNLAQIFVNVTSGTFVAGENITNALVSPTQSLTVTSISTSINATHSYEDADGEIVDIPPNTGIVPAGYVEITHRDYYEEKNSTLASVKVLKESIVDTVSIRYREIIGKA